MVMVVGGCALVSSIHPYESQLQRPASSEFGEARHTDSYSPPWTEMEKERGRGREAATEEGASPAFYCDGPYTCPPTYSSLDS